MKIMVNEKNRGKLEEAIREAEGRATARTIIVRWIYEAAERIEKTLGIPKNAMVGIKADVDYYNQNFPNAYKFTPESTQFTLERFASGWAVTAIWRGRTKRAGHEYTLTLTDLAKEKLIERFEVFC